MFLRVNGGEYEFVEKKSRFIALSYAIDSRADVKPLVDGLREKYKDATHVCYAFVADEVGLDFGYYDDGEPSGTAGKPIYSALTASGAVKTLIAVVRYFGGVKLGAGGLTRAYRAAAAELIKYVGMSKSEKFVAYEMWASADSFKKINASLGKIPSCSVTNIVYNGDVEFDVIAPPTADIAGMATPFGARILRSTEKYVNIAE